MLTGGVEPVDDAGSLEVAAGGDCAETAVGATAEPSAVATLGAVSAATGAPELPAVAVLSAGAEAASCDAAVVGCALSS